MSEEITRYDDCSMEDLMRLRFRTTSTAGFSLVELLIVTAIMAIAVYPFGPTITLPFLGSFPLVIARFDVALLYVLGVTSVGVYGIALDL